MSDRVGFWADMDDPYITYDNNYIESVWWSLKQVADKGLLYKGHKVVPYCPRCGTALSSHEVSQGYKTVTEKSAFVRFKVKGEENTWLYAWTTTPWTLPSNVALCVNPDEIYARFDFEGRTVIMAQALIHAVLGEDAAVENITLFEGRDLVGMEYEPLFDFQKPLVNKPAWRVVADSYVTMTDGTGIVHQAPAFGEDDARVGRENDLPFLQLVDTRGRMAKETPWAGTFVKDADPLILEDLEARGLLVKAEEFTHDYPFCWRLRYAADLLRPRHLVHPHDGGEGAVARLQPLRQLDAGQHQGRPHGQLPRKRHRLGPLPRALLGHAAARMGVRVRPHARHRLAQGIGRAGA